ncbi:DNA/RNA-binding protein KIN17, partial [Lecanoromycetidae sp. Uapishka_2]
MPKAEVGSTKYLNNKLKSKGLQRLRWYCQVCEKQCRDENGFKCHVASESHTRQMQVIGETGANKVIGDYSNQFQHDFIQLLRTSHNTKAVHINHFYQQMISDKEHVHMNSTKWPSLTEFAKHLGREGICRVEEKEGEGLFIAWIDNSPEALRRQEAIRKKERQDKGDEEREQKLIRDQIERAELAIAKARQGDSDELRELKREDGAMIKLNFGSKAKEDKDTSPPAGVQDVNIEGRQEAQKEPLSPPSGMPSPPSTDVSTPPPEKISLKMGTNSKPKNIFAGLSKKNALGSKGIVKEPARKHVSEVERIMKEEIERKRIKGADGSPGLNVKRQRLG